MEDRWLNFCSRWNYINNDIIIYNTYTIIRLTIILFITAMFNADKLRNLSTQVEIIFFFVQLLIQLNIVIMFFRQVDQYRICTRFWPPVIKCSQDTRNKDSTRSKDNWSCTHQIKWEPRTRFIPYYTIII